MSCLTQKHIFWFCHFFWISLSILKMPAFHPIKVNVLFIESEYCTKKQSYRSRAIQKYLLYYIFYSFSQYPELSDCPLLLMRMPNFLHF